MQRQIKFLNIPRIFSFISKKRPISFTQRISPSIFAKMFKSYHPRLRKNYFIKLTRGNIIKIKNHLRDMKENTPKILLAAPTFEGKEYCLDFFVKRIREIQKITPCDVLFIDNSKTSRYANLIEKKYKIKVIRSKHYPNKPITSLAEARKKLYQYVLKNKYDYLFSLEQDIFPPKEIIKHLLSIRRSLKDEEAVIGTPYEIASIRDPKNHIETDRLTSVAQKRIYSKRMKRMIQKLMTRKQMIKRQNIFQVHACGFGCTLIEASILKKIKLKYNEKSHRPDDALFYIDCEKLKIPVYVDPNLMDYILHIQGSSIGIS